MTATETIYGRCGHNADCACGAPFDLPEPCPECGSEDAEYLPHEPGCPSGFPTIEVA
jgi:hypothetical protein